MPGSPTDQALAHLAAGRFEAARLVLARALAGAPADASLNSLMCRALASMGRFEQAEFYIRRAAAARPDDADILNDLGNLLALTGRTADAADVLARAAALDPAHLGAAVSLAAVLSTLRRPVAAAAHCERAARTLGHAPDLAIAHAGALLDSARAAEAAAVLRAAAARHPGHALLLQRLAFAMNSVPGVDPAEIAAAHRAAGAAAARAAQGAPALPPVRPAVRDRPLRLGLLSPDLRTHSVAFFVRPIVERLDRGRFEVVAYCDSAVEDAMTRCLRAAADEWRTVHALDDVALARAIRADRIDILVDLAGYTSRPRTLALLLRPAPLQVAAIGYPADTGLPAIDLRLTDSLADPPPSDGGAGDGQGLLRCEPCFLCYTPPIDVERDPPRIGPPPRESAGAVTFASFNSIHKVNEPLMRLWARVVAAVPGSRLLLKGPGLDEPDLRRDLAARFAAAGLSAERLELLAYAPSQREHLALYGRVDAALDTYPYNGTTTTCEAMWMGVPTVTLVGRAHASRVGLTLNSAAGLADLCAADEDAYVAAAAGLAADRRRLADLRATLRSRLAASPLGDAAAYAERLGAALCRAWDRAVADAARASPSPRKQDRPA
jgi:predicted O-linked N-acetylglucosamine transferase (SPINDLY family)